MTTASGTRRTDSASLEIHASPAEIFDAFTDGNKLMQWLPPDTMTGEVLTYDFREGGSYRIALTRDASADRHAGKTEGRTDVSHGRFLTVEPDRGIVQSVVFESKDPAFAGEMIMTWTFEPSDKGTKVSILADNVPPGISEADHARGLRSTLANLARYVTRR